ncbi:hypothetical protein ABMA27_016968 [Loxostege sticticalis]|uniref:Iris-A n=1 Tax=Loxostege sticticalis TaxID=481309 RepID=A0ABR3GYR1_LOXSC
MEKLDDQHYILSFPHPSRVQLLCGRQDYITLQGSYLITIPIGCQLKTSEFTITNENDEIKGQPLKLTEIPSDAKEELKTASHIDLNSVNLQELHSIQKRIMMEAPIDNTGSSFDSLYHTTIPFYVVLLAAGMLLIFILHRRYNIWKCNQTTKREEYPNPSEDQQRPDAIPATFSLNVLK